jgi:hypothetical protein
MRCQRGDLPEFLKPVDFLSPRLKSTVFFKVMCRPWLGDPKKYEKILSAVSPTLRVNTEDHLPVSQEFGVFFALFTTKPSKLAG